MPKKRSDQFRRGAFAEPIASSARSDHKPVRLVDAARDERLAEVGKYGSGLSPAVRAAFFNAYAERFVSG